jgi:pilus assembly protein CpaB
MIIRAVLIALILSGLGGFGTIVWMMVPDRSAAIAAVPVPKKVALVTVAKALHAGTLLQPDDLSSAEIDVTKIPAGAVTNEADNKHALVGGLVLRALSPGDVLRLPADALRPTDHGFLSAVLKPGTRAVTVGVDAVSGAAGLIWPGDHVDLILTQSVEDQTVAPGRRVSAETILRDVRVIAIDQQIGQGDVHAPTDANAVAKTVTLEVTPSSAEYVQVASRLGRLSLTLRAATAGPGDAVAPKTTWASDVSAALPQKPDPTTTPSSIHVFQGSADGKEFKF